MKNKIKYQIFSDPIDKISDFTTEKKKLDVQANEIFRKIKSKKNKKTD